MHASACYSEYNDQRAGLTFQIYCEGYIHWGRRVSDSPYISSTLITILTTVILISTQTHDSDVKQNAILQAIVSQLITSCSCRVSVKYIAQGNLSCGDGTTDRVLLHGALISAQESASAELHTQLQDWVNQAPTVEVIGIPLQVIPCSTYLGDEISCAIHAPMGTTSISVVNPEENKSGFDLGGVPVYASVLGGLVALVIVIVFVVVVVVAVKRKRRTKRYEINVVSYIVIIVIDWDS